ncbi:MAG TPA: ATP synthase F1 subunit gamma [Chthoniobacteraceae bacterium]|nr:ATP synthase F1 subunit gamma [Chthoniobacteraceae bacterium]
MAANTRDIRRRIKSVKNTSQITKAMQMVAAAKMRKAQNAAVAGRSYADLLRKVFASLADKQEEGAHPLLDERPVKKELVVVISTDKGLCGALNTNLFREVGKFDPENTVFVVIGKKAMQYLARSNRKVLAEFMLKENFSFLEAKQVSKFCMDKFLEGEVDRVTIAFTDFVNTLTQIPRTRVVLPITNFEVADVLSSADKQVAAPVETGSAEYLFEPDANAVLNAVLPHYVHFQLFQMVLDSRASEHSARMVAMKNATDNAKQLIKDLTLEYNKIRQASITTEILEISTAQAALG